MTTEVPKFKVRKKKLGSYPYLSVVLSITLALFVTGVFGLLVIARSLRFIGYSPRIGAVRANHAAQMLILIRCPPKRFLQLAANQ